MLYIRDVLRAQCKGENDMQPLDTPLPCIHGAGADGGAHGGADGGAFVRCGDVIRLGARAVFHGAHWAEANEEALTIAEKVNGELIHPFEKESTWRG